LPGRDPRMGDHGLSGSNGRGQSTQIGQNGSQSVKFLDRHVALVVGLALLCVSLATVAQAAKSTSESFQSLRLIGWRQQSEIVLRGDVSGLDRLRELAGNIELRADSRMAPQGKPLPLVETVVSTLLELQAGFVEIKDGKISVVGLAEPGKIDKLNATIRQRASEGVRIAKLQIRSPEEPPYQWAGHRYHDEYGSDTIEMDGRVIDETARAKLISMARAISDDMIVIDKMKVEPGLSSRVNGAAVAGLAQLSALRDGFVWIDENRIDLLGSSGEVGASDTAASCKSLAGVMPRGVQCGIVNIVQQEQRHRHRHGRSAYDDGTYRSRPKPFTAVQPDKLSGSPIDEASDPRVVDILFATLRKAESADSPASPAFSGERAQALNYGRARVRIPEDHKIGRLELPGGFSIFGIHLTREEADPKRHFILRSRQPLTLEQWDSLIDTIGPDEAVVFVHGFNTSFDDSAFRFAQIIWDLQYKGLPVLFSWPSRGAVIDYPYDRESALYARDAFISLLANLRDGHKIHTVHVIAHSMGNFLVLEALARQTGSSTGAMGQLIMAAPDVDRDQFLQDVAKIREFFRGLTLYASSADRALALSKRVAGGIPRAGDVSAEGPICLPDLETLDVTALGEEMFGLNHTTFAQARPLIDDIHLILHEGRHAPRLAQVRPVPEGARYPRYWRFAP
jgi:esterase/lipase superfamily enzyme